MSDDVAFLKEALEQERTERARADAARAKAEGGIRARDEFLLSLCHELQTPLAVIVMRSDMLLRRHDDPTGLEHGLQSIRAGARNHAAIIDNVVEFNRMLEGKPDLAQAPVDLLSCVQDVLDQVAYVADEKKITIRFSPGPVSWVLRGDPHRLTLAIHNLVSNALKFTPSGGTVDISMEHGPKSASVRVSDTGAGFSPEVGQHLFDPITHGGPEPAPGTTGLGLGLAVVGWIARIHGGTISASSEGPTRGSSFLFTIPAVLADDTGSTTGS